MSKKPFALSRKSQAKLGGVHPDLVKVVKRAIEITPVDFGITEGLRSVTRQKELVAAGKSMTMNSRHLTGHAVDVVAYKDGKVSWDFGLYERIADAMFEAAKEYDITIVWGGLFKDKNGNPWPDGPHFELHRGKYP